MRYGFSEDFFNDLEELLIYTGTYFGQKQVNLLIDVLVKGISNIKMFPLICPEVKGRREVRRKLFHKQGIVIYYKIEKEKLFFLRIISFRKNFNI